MTRFSAILDPLSPHQKKMSVGPPLAKLSGSAHDVKQAI